MRLVRLQIDSFQALERNWRGQCEAYSENFDDFAVQQLSHARSVVSEPGTDERYGIFGVESDGRFDALMHVNRARLPGTDGHTLRLVWVLLAPEFDFDDVTPERFGTIAACIINEALRLSAASSTEAEHIKIHLGNLADREYFHRSAELLKGMPYFSDARVRGNWFHLSKAKS